jgi:hypothetical protein
MGVATCTVQLPLYFDGSGHTHDNPGTICPEVLKMNGNGAACIRGVANTVVIHVR